MTTTELLADLRTRGLNISVTTAGRLRVEPRAKLTADDRAALRERTRAVLALLAIERTRREQAEAIEADRRQRQADVDARQAAERGRRHVEWLASLDEPAAVALADAGKLTPEDVALWREARDLVERLVARQYAAVQIAYELARLGGGGRVFVRFR